MAGATKRRWLLQPGDSLNNTYRIDRPLGHGGMGEVYLGHSMALDEDVVAIKVILPEKATDENFRQLFGREARALLRVRHPSVVGYRSFSHDLDLDLHYIVTDFVEGVNLAERLKQGPLQKDEFERLSRAIIGGLQAVHETGIIHRDFAPDNVILEDGDLAKPKIIDFGVVKDTQSAMTTIVGDNIVGKMNFMSPEQLGKPNYEVGPWTDVYALGLCLLAAYRGEPADMGGSFADAIDKRQKRIDMTGVDADTRAFLEQLLQTHPEDRPQSMEAVLALLDRPTAAPTVMKAPPAVEQPEAEPDDAEAKPVVAVPSAQATGDEIAPAADTIKEELPRRRRDPSPEPEPTESKKRSKALLIGTGLVGIMAMGGASYWWSSGGFGGDDAPETKLAQADDADWDDAEAPINIDRTDQELDAEAEDAVEQGDASEEEGATDVPEGEDGEDAIEGEETVPVPLPPTPSPPPTIVAPPPAARCQTGPFFVFFDWDSSSVTPDAAAVLNQVAATVAGCGRGTRVFLAGHTDRSNTEDYNVALSARQNRAVASYLVGRGVPSSSISSRAYGESQPRVSTPDGVRELQNRRVEITIRPARR